jgi:hypothetical protein
MASSLPPFPPFNVEDDPTATGQRWTKWKKRFENFLLAMDIDDETCKRALLLHYFGSSAFDPRADGAKRRARVLTPPGYLHPGKRKH